MVMLMPTTKDAMQFMPGGTSRTDANGEFTLTGVTPGDYSLQIQSMGGLISAAGAACRSRSGSEGSAPAAVAGARVRAATVNVAGEDIIGMVVVGTRGAKASGTICYGGGAKPEGATAIRVTAPAVDADSSPMPTFGASNVKDTGAFEVDSLIGQRVFRAVNLPKGWVLKEVRLNGEDVTDKGVEFKPGEDVSGLEIELTNKTTSINGGVNDDRNSP